MFKRDTVKTAMKEFWNERYAADGYIYGTAPNDFLKEHIDAFPAGGRILSLAEGEGRNAVFLAQNGLEVIGVDYAAQGRIKALDFAAQQNVEIDYQIADLTEYNVGRSQWDGIIWIFCHLPSHDRRSLYQKAKEGIKSGGTFLLEAFNERQIDHDTGGPKDPDLLISCAELEDAYTGWEALHSVETNRPFDEGSGHKGTGYVTQFIARKP